MKHLALLPILLPFASAAMLLALNGTGIAAKRAATVGAIAANGVLALLMLVATHDGTVLVYRLGDWPAPYGIVLAADRLSALMVGLTAFVALLAALIASGGDDQKGAHFHAILLLQIAGLNGAFLTGDLFNLFVFFEILLLASYILLMHGRGAARSRAGLGFVVLNLAGSALFLIALGLVYGTLGTLNMADLAVAVRSVAPDSQALVRAALMLLVAVFLLKAAVLPLGLWLPHVYTAALLPVAVLFVIMTKVGIYALIRISGLALAAAPHTADLLQPWLAWLGIATIVLGALGALAARRGAFVAANVIVVSSGTLVMALAAGGPRSTAALVYYLVHTTLATAALLILIQAIAARRGAIADGIEKGPRPANFLALGAAYLIVAVAVSGAPPLTGFLGKLMLMRALAGEPSAAAAWAALIGSGFVLALVLARMASAFFWEGGKGDAPAAPTKVPLVLFIAVGATLLPVLFAAPLSRFAQATAAQLADRDAYTNAVLGRDTAIKRERRP